MVWRGHRWKQGHCCEGRSCRCTDRRRERDGAGRQEGKGRNGQHTSTATRKAACSRTEFSFFLFRVFILPFSSFSLVSWPSVRISLQPFRGCLMNNSRARLCVLVVKTRPHRMPVERRPPGRRSPAANHLLNQFRVTTASHPCLHLAISGTKPVFFRVFSFRVSLCHPSIPYHLFPFSSFLLLLRGSFRFFHCLGFTTAVYFVTPTSPSSRLALAFIRIRAHYSLDLSPTINDAL